MRVALWFSSDLGMFPDFSEKVKMRAAKSPNPKSKKLIRFREVPLVKQ